MRNTCLLILLFGSLLIGCKPDNSSPYYDDVFPDTATNFGNINSSYDDYNSFLPITGGSYPLVFSSNRNSAGNNFDFVYKWLDISMHKKTGVFTIGENTDPNNGYMSLYIKNQNIESAVKLVNSGADEMGPYLIHIGNGTTLDATNRPVEYYRYAFLYATNQGGNLDIRYVEDVSTGTYGNPKALTFLNSAKDDAYPCITKDSTSIYFCSNRDGNFDIFKADLPLKGGRFLKALSDSTSQHTVSKDSDLSSAYDDKCPYIFDNLMIFTSNRPGGFGGYDLYYSRFENGKWGAPVNFGAKINTASDEYRPIIMPMQEFSNYFMIFSSNRPGGKGGFDLYYAGVAK
jgi:hypothetical protein